MADQNTLTSQQPKEKVKNAAVFDPVFGGFELDSLYELVAKGQGEFVNEAPLNQMPEHKVDQSKFSPEGTIRGFQKQRGIEVDATTAEQLKVWRVHIAKAPVKEKRVEINELDSLQVLYQGSVDNEGNVTAYHQTEADKKQSENIAFDIQQQRAERLKATVAGRKTSSKAAVSGAIDYFTQQKMAGERTGMHALSAPG